MKTLLTFSSITAIMMMTFTTLSFASGIHSHSGQAVKESVAAGSHASRAVAHSIAASGQVVSGAVAVPLMSAGAAGAVSSEMGQALWDAANAPANGPLEISDETVTVGPLPDEVVEIVNRQ